MIYLMRMPVRPFLVCAIMSCLLAAGGGLRASSHAPLTSKEQKILLAVARDTLDSSLSGKPLPRVHSYQLSDALKKKCGVFVTLKTKGTGKLRGCIGYITGRQALAEAVRNCTVMAATRDTRFPPMKHGEAETVFIEISVLTPLKKIHTIAEIEVGSHGLFIENSGRSGLLLPQVPVDWGWNKKQFLQAVCRKAGLPHSAWQEDGTHLYIFSAQVWTETGVTETGH